jgi:hypothetical protein
MSDSYKKQIKAEISKKYIDILNGISKDGNHDRIVEEALKDYIEKNGLEKIEDPKNIDETHYLAMIPVYKNLWDYSDKGELVVGKRKIREIYGFKTFLNFSDTDLKEFDRLQKKIKELKNENKFGTVSDTQKDHIDISIDELKHCDKGRTYSLLKGNDGIYGLIKCSEINNVLNEEFYYKDKLAKFYAGKYIVVFDTMEELKDLVDIYNSLVYKLDKLAVMIYEGYKPIHLKWEKIRIEKEKGLRSLHFKIQFIVAILIFTAITVCYLMFPRVFYFPMPDETVAGYRYFLGAYVLSLPVFLIIVNYIVIFAVWFNGRLALIRNNVRKIVDKDIRALREKIGFDVFR